MGLPDWNRNFIRSFGCASRSAGQACFLSFDSSSGDLPRPCGPTGSVCPDQWSGSPGCWHIILGETRCICASPSSATRILETFRWKFRFVHVSIKRTQSSNFGTSHLVYAVQRGPDPMLSVYFNIAAVAMNMGRRIIDLRLNPVHFCCGDMI